MRAAECSTDRQKGLKACGEADATSPRMVPVISPRPNTTWAVVSLLPATTAAPLELPDGGQWGCFEP